MSLVDVIRTMTINPARILHLDVGMVGLGKMADLTIFDPDEEWVIDPNEFRSKGRNTPFAGMKVKGKVKYTIVGGNIIYDYQK
jgi:dihydroorotase